MPLQLEFGIRKQGTLVINGRERDLSSADIVFMDNDNTVVKVGDDCLMINGGIVQHRMYNPDDSCLTRPFVTRLMITPITPFMGRIQIVCG